MMVVVATPQCQQYQGANAAISTATVQPIVTITTSTVLHYQYCSDCDRMDHQQPSQSDHHVRGMLDRDQRTTAVNLQPHSAWSSICCGHLTSTRNHRYHSSQYYNTTTDQGPNSGVYHSHRHPYSYRVSNFISNSSSNDSSSSTNQCARICLNNHHIDCQAPLKNHHPTTLSSVVGSTVNQKDVVRSNHRRHHWDDSGTRSVLQNHTLNQQGNDGSRFSRTSGGRSRSLTEALRKLTTLCIAGLYLGCVVTFPSSLAAPLNNKKIVPMEIRMKERPKWINPCGLKLNALGDIDPNDMLASDEDSTAAAVDLREISNAELLTQIVDQASIAHFNAQQFETELAQFTLGMTPKQLNLMWRHINYSWLPTVNGIPKYLGKRLSKNHLEMLELDATLLDVYQYLQMVAVGVEQMYWDQLDEEGPFRMQLYNTENNLQNMLCELQISIYERNLKQPPDITRDHMASEFRHPIDKTSKNVRNWLIYRDYVNVLQYIIQCFTYFKSRL